MTPPTADEFEDFFRAANMKGDGTTFDPFPWQKRLAADLCRGEWPATLALPTASGKTGCIDIALFALACGAAGAPRRICFVVDRRVVVDQARKHARDLARLLKDAKDGILLRVGDALRDIAHPGWRALPESTRKDVRPLDVYALRGGMYRENAWARSPLQPTLIASTVDQVGSRLLFRGYGVSDCMKPVHAGLIGNDAVIFLDEAHCAKPFEQTVRAVRHYREWNASRGPFRFVSITATPTTKEGLFELGSDDREHGVLKPRLEAEKPAELVLVKKAKLIEELRSKAETLMGASLGADKKGVEHTVRAVGVIVNRVKTARKLAQLLKTVKAAKGVAPEPRDVILLTGRMRPVDRDKVLSDLEPLFSGSKQSLERPTFVVATQCLEVGADLDFHALVTECASLDALRQRFGRLNRVAARPAAKAAILCTEEASEPQEEPKKQDPVYGNSLPNTWQFLRATERTEFDFGVNAIEKVLCDVEKGPLNAPTADAPLLFPAHLDCWVQTHPVPEPDPDPAPFLHGPKKPGQPDVQVVFRSDLPADPVLWVEAVALCPPSSAEAVAVPISAFKKWLAGEAVDDNVADVEGEAPVEEIEAEETGPRQALRWAGAEDSEIVGPQTVKPFGTYIVPVSADALELGDFPDGVTDESEPAFQKARDLPLLKLPGLRLDEETEDEDAAIRAAISARKTAASPPWEVLSVDALQKYGAKGREIEPHPNGGYVVTGKVRLKQYDPTYLPDSEPASSYRGQKEVTLEAHSAGVAAYAKKFAAGCGLDAELYFSAGLWHDLGKLDRRFQAMLKLCSPRTAVGTPWAKSAKPPRTPKERDEQRAIHQYPKSARHELLSVALLDGKADDDLLLHLIATHHGSARPFAAAVIENDAGKWPVKGKVFDRDFSATAASQDIAAWNGPLAERFWRVVRAYGWWGAAYLETVFRLADHAQSRAEQDDPNAKVEPVTAPAFAGVKPATPTFELALTGLDGANPLAFLAALGTLATCDTLSRTAGAPPWLGTRVRLSWRGQTPVLHLAAAIEQDDFVTGLVAALPPDSNSHPAVWAVTALNEKELDVQRIRKVCELRPADDAARLAWVSALVCEAEPGAASQLQTVRKDYLIGNIDSVLARTRAEHLHRALFAPWDYADALANQSFHWEPSEDRRHAYQWYMPSGDPTRNRGGGMLGANRLAFEAWPLFPSFPAGGGKVRTRGFRGVRANDTTLSWPLWSFAASSDVVASLLGSPLIVKSEPDAAVTVGAGIATAFRLQRILVGKTPNFTTAFAVT